MVKSTFTAAIASDVKRMFPEKDTAIIAIFLAHGRPSLRELAESTAAEAVLRVILRQLIENATGDHAASPVLLQALASNRAPTPGGSLGALRTLILEEIAKFGKVFLLVDGLDRCPEASRSAIRNEMVDLLQISSQSRPQVLRLMLVEILTDPQARNNISCDRRVGSDGLRILEAIH